MVRCFPLLLEEQSLLLNLGFDPDQLWAQVQDKNVTNIVIVGDAFARPMLDALGRTQKALVTHMICLSSNYFKWCDVECRGKKRIT